MSHGETVLWRNRWSGRHWSDDHLATAAMLADMAAWVSDRSLPEPYPLRDALQDAATGFALAEAVERDAVVGIDDEPWW